ncbi:YajG family lipoprotein [Thalassotalea aquiviva]|uniref:YajG family lipoprotein n=1 Tax=Thalassotalea aquiviva TaxID=3242415 RepID=UPI00352B1F94
MKLKLIPVISIALLLAACASEPETITLKPQLTNKPMQVYSTKPASLSVYDNRAQSHIVEIITSQENSSVINTDVPLSSVLDQQFSQEMANQGLVFSHENADLSINFQVKRARTYVNQDVLDYRANTIIKLNVIVENPAQTLSKTFTLRATNRGPLKANVDKLQKDFNLQLSKLIVQVLEDEQLQSFIKG